MFLHDYPAPQPTSALRYLAHTPTSFPYYPQMYPIMYPSKCQVSTTPTPRLPATSGGVVCTISTCTNAPALTKGQVKITTSIYQLQPYTLMNHRNDTWQFRSVESNTAPRRETSGSIPAFSKAFLHHQKQS